MGHAHPRPRPAARAAWSLWLAMAGAAFAQAPQLSGRVVDESGAPLAGAVVELLGANLNARTDAAGRYAFGVSSGLPPTGPGRAFSAAPRLEGGILAFGLAEPGRVSVEAWSASGSRSRPLRSGRYAAGSHRLPLAGLPAGLHWIRVGLPASEAWFRAVADGRGGLVAACAAGLRESGPRSQSVLGPALQRRTWMGGSEGNGAAPQDTLRVSKDGYESAVRTLDPPSGTVADVVLKRGLAFVPFFIGNGDIEDIATGGRIRLPMHRRIHILLFAEGYTEADHRAGRFEAAVSSWYESVFAVDPLSGFKQAFVIWKFPAVSLANVSTAGGADTYFKVPVTSSGVGSVSSLAAPIWSAVAKFPYAASLATYPSGGGTSNVVKNLVGQFLILDPRSGRAGFSGLASTFANPADSRQRLKACFGQTQQHEFFHSFSLVSDEYYDVDHGGASTAAQDRSSALDNVSGNQTCAGLPWKHLLPGGAVNATTQDLIGAFGAGGRWHSEFKCLMNGNHDNASLFGGNGSLRLNNRLCNWDRELALFRLYERAEVLADNAAAWSNWTASYRAAFYRKFPLYAPAVLPQQTSEGKGVFLACTQGAEPRPAVAEAIDLPGDAVHGESGHGEDCDR